MAPRQEPVLPERPGRPRWVYGIGMAAMLVVLAASLFAVVYRSEHYVAPEKGEPPIVTVPAAPGDGER